MEKQKGIKYKDDETTQHRTVVLPGDQQHNDFQVPFFLRQAANYCHLQYVLLETETSKPLVRPPLELAEVSGRQCLIILRIRSHFMRTD